MFQSPFNLAWLLIRAPLLTTLAPSGKATICNAKEIIARNTARWIDTFSYHVSSQAVGDAMLIDKIIRDADKNPVTRHRLWPRQLYGAHYYEDNSPKLVINSVKTVN